MIGEHALKPAPGSRKGRKRVGRGPGSGRGKTAGRGEKGQKSRSGYARRRGFEGGQMPLYRRVPKRGFRNPFATDYRTVNVERLNGFAQGSEVTPDVLESSGLLRKGRSPVKILGGGELRVALTVRAHKFTRSAAAKIESAGGRAEPLERDDS